MRRSRLVAVLLLAGLSVPARPAAADNDPQRAYLEGLVRERFGRPADALAFYRRAAELDPASRFLQEALAGLCLRIGRLDESLAAARRAAALAGPDPSAQVLLGRIHLARGDRAAAGRAFDQALFVNPAYGEALVYAAYLRSSDEPAKALGFLERYLKENPDSVEALTRIAGLQESLKNIPKAEEFWRRAAERSPSDPEIHAALARLAEGREDRATAAAEYEAARFLDPRNVQVLVPLGETYYRMGRGAEAKETLEEALRLSPDDTAARFGLALLAEDAGDWDGAARQMALVARDTDQTAVPLHLAHLQMMSGRFKDAVKTLLRARRSDPRNADVWMYLGISYDQLGRRRRGLACFREAVRLDPDRAEARFHFAEDLDVLGRFPEAEPQLLKAIALDPKSAAALNYLGFVWADRGERLGEALPLLKRAVDLEPGNPAILDSLGWCYFKMGRLSDADTVLSGAVHKMEDPVIWEHYGDVLKALGRQPEAVRAWQEGYILDPRSRSLRKRLGGRGQATRVRPLTAPRAVLKRVEGNFRPLRGLAGGVTVTVRGGPRSAVVDGVFYYMRPRLFRVEVLGGFLAPAALLVSNAEGVHAVAPGGAAPQLPGGDAWFNLLGDVFSGELARKFDDPSVRVEQKGSDLLYRSSAGELRIDGRRKTLTRVSAGGVVLRFEEYRDVEGFRLPGAVRVDLPGGASLSISFRRVRVNPDLGAGMFETPKEAP